MTTTIPQHAPSPGPTYLTPQETTVETIKPGPFESASTSARDGDERLVPFPEKREYAFVRTIFTLFILDKKQQLIEMRERRLVEHGGDWICEGGRERYCPFEMLVVWAPWVDDWLLPVPSHLNCFDQVDTYLAWRSGKKSRAFYR